MALTAKQIAAMDSLSGYQKPDPIPGWLKFLIPAAGATVGGIAGAGLGGLAGIETGPGAALTGYAGGVAGAGLGAAGGQAGINLLERAFGGPVPATAGDNAQSLIKAGKSGAVGQAIGVPVAKGLGFIAHPIANVAGQLDAKLAASPAMVDVGETLARFKPLMQQKFAQQTIGREGQQSINNLEPNVISAVKALQTHIPAENVSPNINTAPIDVADMSLPVKAANQLKRGIYNQIDYTKPTNNPDVVVRKVFSNLLKNDVHQAAPISQKYDAVLKFLYAFPNAARTLTNLIPNGAAQQAARVVGDLPFKGIQKAIPQSGGYLQKLLPGLFTGIGNSGNN